MSAQKRSHVCRHTQNWTPGPKARKPDFVQNGPDSQRTGKVLMGASRWHRAGVRSPIIDHHIPMLRVLVLIALIAALAAAQNRNDIVDAPAVKVCATASLYICLFRHATT